MEEKRVLVFSLLLLVVAFFSGTFGPTGYYYKSQSLENCPYGDVNEDGYLSTRDMEKLNDYLNRGINVARDVRCADLDNDGSLTQNDKEILVELLGMKQGSSAFSAKGDQCQLGEIQCISGAPGSGGTWGGKSNAYARCVIGRDGRRVWDREHPEFCDGGEVCVVKTYVPASSTQYQVRRSYSTCEHLKTA